MGYLQLTILFTTVLLSRQQQQEKNFTTGPPQITTGPPNTTTEPPQITTMSQMSVNGSPIPPFVIPGEDAINIAVGCVTAVMSLAAIVGNILIVFVIINNHNFRNLPTNIFIMSLACCDMLTGVCVLSLRSYSSFRGQLYWYLSKEVCWFVFLTEHTFSISSILHLSLICTDRFFGIIFPFAYKNFFTTTKRNLVLLLTWVVSIVFSCLNSFSWEDTSLPGVVYQKEPVPVCVANNPTYYHFIYIVVFFIPLLLMICGYTSICVVVVRRRTNRCNRQDTNGQIKRQEWRVLKTVIVVFASHLICWIPNLIITFWGIEDTLYWNQFFQTNPQSFLIIYSICINIMPALSACINPIIYGFVNEKYKKELVRILKNRTKNYHQSFTIRTTTSSKTITNDNNVFIEENTF